MAHSSSFSWLVMLSWILALLLWTLLLWTFDQSGAYRNLLHSTTIITIIIGSWCRAIMSTVISNYILPTKEESHARATILLFSHSTKHGSNLPTLSILFHLWHLMVIQSHILLVSLVKLVVLLSFFDHSWNSNFSALEIFPNWIVWTNGY